MLEGLRALLVEDDQDLRDQLAHWLRDAGAEPHESPTLGQARASVREQGWHALVVDRRLPDGDGFDALLFNQPMERLASIGWVGLSGHWDAAAQLGVQKVGGVAVMKPVTRDELVNAVLLACERRGLRPAGMAAIVLGEHRLHVSRNVLEGPGGPIALSVREIELLVYMNRFRGQWLTSDDLRLWALGRSDEHGRDLVWKYLSTLAKKLGDEAYTSLIDHERGKGYRLRW